MNVYCLGDLMTDIVARLSAPLAIGSDTPAPVGLFGGGSAANTACWLAHLGRDTTFVGRVGDDALGRDAVNELAALGVRTAVRVDPLRPTGTCIVLVDASGERTMIPDAGANSGLQIGDLPAFEGDSHLHVSGYSLLNDAARPAALAAMTTARTEGLTISVDAASAAPIAAVGPDRFLDWIGSGVLLFANEDEARILTTVADAARAAQLLAKRCGLAVVKRGKAGALFSDGASMAIQSAIPAQVVDSTGAGDAFAAGFLDAWLADGSPVTALTAGCALASVAVGQPGARPQLVADTSRAAGNALRSEQPE